MKQTAVEWLESCLTEKHSNGSFVWNTRADLESLFKQAKEMEKEQIINAWELEGDEYVRNGKDYYEVTFKK